MRTDPLKPAEWERLRSACVVYDRTSGDEDQGQDAKAQLADSVHRAEQAGFDPRLAGTDEDVSGDTPWNDRNELRRLLGAIQLQPMPLVTREITRLWRGDPFAGMVYIEALPNLVVLGQPIWERRDGAWIDQSETAPLLRFVQLWQSWAEKRRASERTLHAVRAIKEGRRPTRTGRGLGRPTVEIESRHLEVADATLALHGLAEAHRTVLALRGFYEAKDPATMKKRYVSKETLARALGLRTSAQKSTPPKSPLAPTDETSAGNRPIVGDRTENDSAPEVQREEGDHE